MPMVAVRAKAAVALSKKRLFMKTPSVWIGGVTVYTPENQSKKNARGSFPKAGLLKKVYNFCVQIMRVYPSRDHRGKP